MSWLMKIVDLQVWRVLLCGVHKNGVLGCKALSPKRSVGLQHPRALNGVLGCNTLSPKLGLGCRTLSFKRSVGLQNPELVSNSRFFLPQLAKVAQFKPTPATHQKRRGTNKTNRAPKKNHPFGNRVARCEPLDAWNRVRDSRRFWKCGIRKCEILVIVGRVELRNARFSSFMEAWGREMRDVCHVWNREVARDCFDPRRPSALPPRRPLPPVVLRGFLQPPTVTGLPVLGGTWAKSCCAVPRPAAGAMKAVHGPGSCCLRVVQVVVHVVRGRPAVRRQLSAGDLVVGAR